MCESKNIYREKGRGGRKGTEEREKGRRLRTEGGTGGSERVGVREGEACARNACVNLDWNTGIMKHLHRAELGCCCLGLCEPPKLEAPTQLRKATRRSSAHEP